MIEEVYFIKHVKKLSDYCKECPYYSPERIETFEPCGRIKEVLEVCGYGNMCDRLYTRLKEEKNGCL